MSGELEESCREHAHSTSTLSSICGVTKLKFTDTNTDTDTDTITVSPTSYVVSASMYLEIIQRINFTFVYCLHISETEVDWQYPLQTKHMHPYALTT